MAIDATVVTQVVVIISGMVIAFNAIRGGASSTARETLQIHKDALAAKEIEVAKMKAQHDTEIAQLRADLATLTAQIDHLKEANMILANTVTGKETLQRIVEVLAPIPGLFAVDGFIAQVQVNQQKTLKDLSEIKKALVDSPSLTNPKNRKFVQRQKVTPPQN